MSEAKPLVLSEAEGTNNRKIKQSRIFSSELYNSLFVIFVKFLEVILVEWFQR